MVIDERDATYLPAPNSVVRPDRTTDRARLRTLALELRAGLVALADEETAWERRWPWLQAAKACEYVVKRLEGAR